MMELSKMNSLSIGGVSLTSLFINGVQVWETAGTLPAAYQQVEYIESTGTQYVDTGVLASDHAEGISYVFRGRLTASIPNNQQTYLWGAMQDNVSAGNAVMFWNAGQWRFYVGGNMVNYWRLSQLIYLARDFELCATASSQDPYGAQITHDGSAFTSTGTAMVAAAMPEANIYLLHCNGATTPKYVGRLYAFTMNTAGGTPIRHFVPCYRKSDGAVGLYDTVSRRFFSNAGDGTFLKGAEV